MGRPSKLTGKVQKQIVKLLEMGVTIADTCAAVGIVDSTYYDWVKRGAEGDEAFSEFSDAVSRAHNAAKLKAIETLRTAMAPYSQTSTKTFTETRTRKDGTTYEYKRQEKTVTRYQGDWRAALEYLKRRFPDEWTERIEVDWKQEFKDAGLDPDAERKRLTEEILRRLRAGGESADAGSLDGGESAT